MPKLLGTLTQHAVLAQEAADAEVMHQAMSHLAHCKREMQSLAALVGEGRLPEVPNVQVTSVAEGSADELGAEQNKQGIGPSEPTTVAVWPVQAQSFWRPGEIDSIFSRELLPGDCLKSWVGKER